MLKILFLLFFYTFINSNNGQVLNRVHVLNYTGYMTEIIGQTVRTVEQREWCNLKLNDITMDVDEQIIPLDMHVTGTIKYTNGFLVSMQRINILQSSILFQRWTINTDRTVQVELRGTLRMIDVALGYDVEAELDDGVRHYTGVIRHPLFEFTFSVIKNVHTSVISVTVTGTHPRTTNVMRILPNDAIGDVLAAMYDSNSTFPGVTAWANDVFEPIAHDIIINKVPFPDLCYNCPFT